MDRRTPPHRHNTPPHDPPHLHSTPPRYLHRNDIPQYNNARTSAYRPYFPIDLPPIDNNTRTPPYRSTSTETTGDLRIHRTSVFDLEQLRNPLVNQYQKRSRDDVHHREQPIAATSLETRMDHVQEMMSQILNLAQDLVEDMKNDNNRRRDRSSSRDHPRYEVHPPNSVLHQAIQEAPLLASPLIKQLETKSLEIIPPAPIVQDSIRRSNALKEDSVQQVQDFKEAVAHQVFVEMPQPTSQADDDDSEGSKSQETEATPKDFPESTPKFNHPVLEIQKDQKEKVHEYDSLMNDTKLGMSWYAKKVQDREIIFPEIDTEELSYVVEVSCKLELVIVALVTANWFQGVKSQGAGKERIGVG